MMLNRKKFRYHLYIMFLVIHSFIIFINCNNSKNKIAHNPIQTALGELVEIELKKEIQVNDKIITSKPEQLLLLLKYQGKTKIPYQSGGNRDNYYVIIDSTEYSSSNYIPIFVGAYDSNKVLSDQFNWGYLGSMTVRDGRTVFSGTIKLTSPEVVVL